MEIFLWWIITITAFRSFCCWTIPAVSDSDNGKEMPLPSFHLLERSSIFWFKYLYADLGFQISRFRCSKDIFRSHRIERGTLRRTDEMLCEVSKWTHCWTQSFSSSEDQIFFFSRRIDSLISIRCDDHGTKHNRHSIRFVRWNRFAHWVWRDDFLGQSTATSMSITSPSPMVNQCKHFVINPITCISMNSFRFSLPFAHFNIDSQYIQPYFSVSIPSKSRCLSQFNNWTEL